MKISTSLLVFALIGASLLAISPKASAVSRLYEIDSLVPAQSPDTEFIHILQAVAPPRTYS